MHLFGAFELDVRPGTPDNPASIRVALLRYTRGEDGRLFITPECATFEEWKDSSIPFKMSSMRSAREPAEHSKSPESGKPHQKAADGFSGLRGTLARQQRRMPARTRGSGHIERVNRLHSASKRMRRCLNQMLSGCGP